MPKPKTTLKDPDIDYRLLDERGVSSERLRRQVDPPLEQARAKGQINGVQYHAGERFRHYWLAGRVTGKWGSNNWDGIPGSGWSGHRLAVTEFQGLMRGRLIKALELLRAEKSKALQDFIGKETPIVEIGFSMGYRDTE